MFKINTPRKGQGFKMTASQQAKRGGMNLTTMADILGYSRQHLHRIFNENPERFDLMLFDAMREKLIRQIRSIKNEQL
jgi:AraC-like DNA-binding protein